MHTQTKLGAKSVPRFARNIFRSRNDNTFNIVLVGVVAPFGKLEVSFTVCPPEKLGFVFAGPPFQRQCWSRNSFRASQEQISDRATTTPSTLFGGEGRRRLLGNTKLVLWGDVRIRSNIFPVQIFPSPYYRRFQNSGAGRVAVPGGERTPRGPTAESRKARRLGALEEARALLKEMGKAAAGSGRAMKKAKAAPKAKSK